MCTSPTERARLSLAGSACDHVDGRTALQAALSEYDGWHPHYAVRVARGSISSSSSNEQQQQQQQVEQVPLPTGL